LGAFPKSHGSSSKPPPAVGGKRANDADIDSYSYYISYSKASRSPSKHSTVVAVSASPRRDAEADVPAPDVPVFGFWFGLHHPVEIGGPVSQRWITHKIF
jgi:hypothetical protein